MPEITINQEKCIGCGACTSVWDNFEVKETDQGFKAVVKKSKIEKKELELAKESAEICPVDAIIIK